MVAAGDRVDSVRGRGDIQQVEYRLGNYSGQRGISDRFPLRLNDLRIIFFILSVQFLPFPFSHLTRFFCS